MGWGKKEKRERNKALRNRYSAGAKLSEHKFLRLLHGFASGMPVPALAPTTRVSARTIRAIYRALRFKLIEAVKQGPERFGGAGRFLLDAEGIRAEAQPLLDAVKRSPHYRRHRKRHAPRLTCPKEEQRLVIEVTVRFICALDLRDVESDDDVMEGLAKGITRLRPRDPLQRLAESIPGAKPHAHPALKFYEDLRRHLLKNPLTGPTSGTQ